MSDSHGHDIQITDEDCVVYSSEENECPECGRVLKDMKGLSQHCRRVHGGRVLIRDSCGFCGCELTDTPRGFGRKDVENHFCSEECRGNWLGETNTGKDHHNYKQVELSCEICGKRMTRCKSYVEKYDEICCSMECMGELRSKTMAGPGNPNYKPEAHTTSTCNHCGESFEHSIHRSNGYYCSLSCKAKDATGEDANNWKGGWVQDDYGPNWDEQREKALERDGWECVDCGMSVEESIEEHGVSLHVHHRERKEKFRRDNGTLDYGRANDLSNLITLCLQCHWKWEKIPVQIEV